MATLKDMGLPHSFDIKDPATYGLPEVESVLNPFGVIGKGPLWTPTILRNRCHPHVIKAFQVACLYVMLVFARVHASGSFLTAGGHTHLFDWPLADRVRSEAAKGLSRSRSNHAPDSWCRRQKDGHILHVPRPALGCGPTELLQQGPKRSSRRRSFPCRLDIWRRPVRCIQHMGVRVPEFACLSWCAYMCAC